MQNKYISGMSNATAHEQVTNRPDAGKAGTSKVSFVCQKCFQPLKLDHSFATLDADSHEEIVGEH